jgi:oligopeptide/dipeptide ABC transporter ATP-binding protein
MPTVNAAQLNLSRSTGKVAASSAAGEGAGTTQNVLIVDGLTVKLAAYPEGSSILDDVSFTVAPGEVLGIVGESGSGKSVLALSIMGLLPPALLMRARRIALLGEDLVGHPRETWRAHRGRNVAMIFQEPMTSLNPVMRVGTQIEEVLRWRGRMRGQAARSRALELLEQVEIPSPKSRLQAYPHELSGGMRQRVMIAIALAAEPKLLIADEPTTALDVTVQAQILDLLRNLQRQSGLSLILITHDLGVIADMTDRVLVLYAGRAAELAPVRTIFDAPAHPYTEALLTAIPDLGPRRHRLATIAGSVPGAMEMPTGCRFAPRCPYRQTACEAAPPPLRPFAAEHLAACIRPFAYETRQSRIDASTPPPLAGGGRGEGAAEPNENRTNPQ